ncbi:XRE family transcriptional regulator [Loigolactobacillus jiayinensis]|uniref:Helix-turn-helix domain-containing protein n=1 Tax=Loigolactobacillus jiayinensis TaxID=2486016 RepID=A0ABW1RGZ7_9LACO|nr:XRE family transcriptional regulator [Loigolactobacillus jiayinensis]
MTKKIGENIKQLRIMNGWSQPQLADKLNVTKQTVSNWETGYREPKMGAIQKLSELYGVSMSAVIDGLSEGTYNVDFSEKESKGKYIPEASSSHTYPFIPAGVAAGSLAEVEPYLINDIQKIKIPDVMMSNYAGDKNVIAMTINGESMNETIPNGSVILVKRFDSIDDLRNGDIVVFSLDGVDYSVKRFVNDDKAHIYSFLPDSIDKSFMPINFRYEDAENRLIVIGKVVSYTVTI